MKAICYITVTFEIFYKPIFRGSNDVCIFVIGQKEMGEHFIECANETEVNITVKWNFLALN